MKVYRVKDWADHFEKNRTKELKFMTWVPFPNKHDGDGYTELVDHPDGASHYGAWCAIVQVASKCDPRGTLLRDGRRPHTAASLARVTRIPEQVFVSAIPRLLNIGWLEVSGEEEKTCDASHEPAVKPHDDAAELPNTVRYGTVEEKSNTERNGTEEQDTERPASAAALVRSVFDHYRTYHPKSFPKPSSHSKEWKLIRDRLAEGYSVDDLRLAIDGNHRSPWHGGENEGGKKYHALELIVRDGSHVQQFMEVPTSRVVLSEKTARSVNAGASYLEKRMGSYEQERPTETD